MSPCMYQTDRFVWNVAKISKKAITFEAFQNVQNASFSRPVHEPFLSIYLIAMVKLIWIQQFHVPWARKCFAFVDIRHQKVNFPIYMNCFLCKFLVDKVDIGSIKITVYIFIKIFYSFFDDNYR